MCAVYVRRGGRWQRQGAGGGGYAQEGHSHHQHASHTQEQVDKNMRTMLEKWWSQFFPGAGSEPFGPDLTVQTLESDKYWYPVVVKKT